MVSAKPLLELELRPVEAPSHATPGARVFVLLPRLDELVGVAGFGQARPIMVPGRGAVSAWALFSRHIRRLRLH